MSEDLRIVLEIVPNSRAGGTATWTRRPSGSEPESIGLCSLTFCKKKGGDQLRRLLDEVERIVI